MKLSNKQIHLIIIILGILFIFIPVFHTNLWFDESYTVGIVSKSFTDIWNIGKHDVHPVLYYWILHVINLIFGSNILLYRLFSTICAAAIGILGYTHIRKDFGEKTGILFSFLAYFLPVNLVYAGEIRMYSMAMLLVTTMSIYAYRIYKNQEEKHVKNWIIFAVCSLAATYTHYYGMMMAFLENLFLFIIYVIQSKKEKKLTYNLKAFIISAVAQIGLYLPWLISLIKQVSSPGGFWIRITFPDFWIEFFAFPFTGNLGGLHYVPHSIAIIYGLLMCAYMIYIHKKNRKDCELKPARIAIVTWGLLALTAGITSLAIWRVIIYARYMFVAGGLFVFFIAATMGNKGKKILNIILIVVTLILSVMAFSFLVQENYGKVNTDLQSYLNENIKDGDILIGCNEGSGFVVAMHFLNNKLYFWDENNWNVDEAYKAFGETVHDFDFLENYEGRIWTINDRDYHTYDRIKEIYDVKLIEQKTFNTEYKTYNFALTLLEK